MVSKSVTLNDLERRNGPYFVLFDSFPGALRPGSCRWLKKPKVVEDVVVKKFAFAISSPDEFLVTTVVHKILRKFHIRNLV